MESLQVDRPKKFEKASTGEIPKPPPLPAPDQHAHEGAIPSNLPKPSWWMILLMVVVLAAALVGLFLVGYLPHEKAAEQAQSDAQAVRSDIPLVTVAVPTQSKMTTDLRLPCDVKANLDTAIFPRTNGYLKKRYVDIDDHVVEGQLLAEIDTPEVDAQLAQAIVGISQAQAMLDKANADLQLANENLDRYHALEKTGAGNVTPQEVQEREAAQQQSSAAVAEAKTQVDAANKTVDRLKVLQSFEKVTAPFTGTITARNYDVGALLSATETTADREMFHLKQTDPARVFVAVPQSYAANIKIGGPAFLTVNNVEYTGSVARAAESLDPITRTMLFELHFPNKDGKLFPNEYGMARLEVTEDTPTLMIPTTALRFDAGGVRVAIVQNGKVHLQPVKTGRDLGTELEIPQGLTADSQVIQNPSERLIEGTPVEIRDPEPKEKVAEKTPAASDAKKASTE